MTQQERGGGLQDRYEGVTLSPSLRDGKVRIKTWGRDREEIAKVRRTSHRCSRKQNRENGEEAILQKKTDKKLPM